MYVSVFTVYLLKSGLHIPPFYTTVSKQYSEQKVRGQKNHSARLKESLHKSSD